MTDEINLDELEVASDDEDAPNPGDWFWQGEGDPPVESEADAADVALEASQSPTDKATATDAESDAVTEDSGAEEDGDTRTRIPHVPRENRDKPVGIPVEQGGAGGTTAADRETETASHPDAEDDETTASGPHGGGVDDMTMALTYAAMQRFEDPGRVIRDAKTWTDWIGIVGDVETFVISTFQRDHGVDVDFFSGSGQSPAERLGDIDEHSMFFAERMVVVGLPDEEAIAARADWEFVPLSTAAEKAGWSLTDPE